MILLENILITPGSLKHSYNRGGLPKFDNFDIFKYSIASISNTYQFSDIILNIKLDDCYKSREQELRDWLQECFPYQKYTLNLGFRCEYQHQWRELISGLKDELVFYSCNHDHIFLDSQTDYFKYCVETFSKYENEIAMFALTHFPDYIPLCKSREYKLDGPGFITNTPEIASFSLVTKSLLKKWFCEVELGHAYIPRSDWEGDLIGKNVKDCIFFCPSREIFRHFDGYNNLACPTSYHMEHYPPLTIPEGFFENDIQLNNIITPLRELPMVWASRIKTLQKEDINDKIHKRLNQLEKTLGFYLGKGSIEYSWFYNQNKRFLQYLYGELKNFKET